MFPQIDFGHVTSIPVVERLIVSGMGWWGAAPDRIRGNSTERIARLRMADGRNGIKRSIYMICVFIFLGRVSRLLGKIFFERSALVGFCRYGIGFMAATSC